MVTTRSGVETRKQSRIGITAFLIISVLITGTALSLGYVVFESIEHKAHSLFQRSSYSFGGVKNQASKYWQDVPSWEDIKNKADFQVLPEPSAWQHTKSFVLRKPVRKIQAEDAVAAGKQWAGDYADTGKQWAGDASDTIKEKAAQAQEGAEGAYSASKGLLHNVRSSLWGLRSKAEQEAKRQRRLSTEAQWRAEYNSNEGFLQKLKYIVLGPRKLPSSHHYDDASGAGSKAYGHAGQAAGEAYEAAKEAAAAAAAAGRGAARSAAGAAAGARDIGGRAADSAGEYAQAAKEKATEGAHAAGEHAQAAYDAAADAAGNVADKVHSEL